MHLFNGTFGIGFAYKLHKTAVLSNGHLHLYMTNINKMIIGAKQGKNPT